MFLIWNIPVNTAGSFFYLFDRQSDCFDWLSFCSVFSIQICRQCCWPSHVARTEKRQFGGAPPGCSFICGVFEALWSSNKRLQHRCRMETVCWFQSVFGLKFRVHVRMLPSLNHAHFSLLLFYWLLAHFICFSPALYPEFLVDVSKDSNSNSPVKLQSPKTF